MDLQRITGNDWSTFMEKYNDAYMYLLRCSLINEYSELCSIRPVDRNEYQAKRFNELDNIYNK